MVHPLVRTSLRFPRVRGCAEVLANLLSDLRRRGVQENGKQPCGQQLRTAPSFVTATRIFSAFSPGLRRGLRIYSAQPEEHGLELVWWPIRPRGMTAAACRAGHILCRVRRGGTPGRITHQVVGFHRRHSGEEAKATGSNLAAGSRIRRGDF